MYQSILSSCQYTICTTRSFAGTSIPILLVYYLLPIVTAQILYFMHNTGGYGGGDSTTSRLHKHITKDTPPRANTHANNNNTTNNRRADATHHTAQYNSGDDSLLCENPFKNADTGDTDQFNSNSSLYAHRGSPSPTRARAELNGDHSGDEHSPSAGNMCCNIYAVVA